MVQRRWAHDAVLFTDQWVPFMTYFRLTCVASAAVLLVACGGSDGPERGALIDPPAVLTTLTAAQIDASAASAGLQALTGKERNVGEIDDAAQIGQPTLSQQLAVLRNAGLVHTRKDAKLVYYRIDESKLGQIVAATEALGSAQNKSVRPSKRPTAGVANFAKLG